MTTAHGPTGRRCVSRPSQLPRPRSSVCDTVSWQWFRNHNHLYAGKYASLDDWIKSDWEGGFVGLWDANDMMVLMRTWWRGDASRLSAVPPELQGDLRAVLEGIRAKGLVMPSKTDLYYPVRRVPPRWLFSKVH